VIFDHRVFMISFVPTLSSCMKDRRKAEQSRGVREGV
jgi:hypothetical protein